MAKDKALVGAGGPVQLEPRRGTRTVSLVIELSRAKLTSVAAADSSLIRRKGCPAILRRLKVKVHGPPACRSTKARLAADLGPRRAEFLGAAGHLSGPTRARRGGRSIASGRIPTSDSAASVFRDHFQRLNHRAWGDHANA